MANNDLNQIRIFHQVAHLKSFTKAAVALEIEKSTVSSKVSLLESHLGVRLLQRTTRSVSLTEAGEQYLAYCEQALQALQSGEDYIAQLSQVPTGRLRISVPQNLVDAWLDILITPFLNQYPDVSLEFIQSNKHVDLIKDKFDLAIRLKSESLEDSSLIYRKLFSSPWIMVASSAHVEKYGLAKTPQQLREQPSVGMSREAPNSQADSEFEWQGETIRLKHRLTLNSMNALKKAIMNDLGFGMVPTNMVIEELANKSLVAIAEDFDIKPTALYVVYPSRTGQPAALKAFVDLIVKWGESFWQ